MGRVGAAGSVSIVDSSVLNCNVGVYVANTGNSDGSLVLDGFSVSKSTPVLSTSGSILLTGSVPSGYVWVMGTEYVSL